VRPKALPFEATSWTQTLCFQPIITIFVVRTTESSSSSSSSSSSYSSSSFKWHYSQLWTFASLMESYQSALFVNLSFQFLILYLLISVCEQFHHLFFGRPLSRFPWGILLNTWLTFLFLSMLLTWPIQHKRPILTNDSISESPSSTTGSEQQFICDYLWRVKVVRTSCLLDTI